MIRKRYLAAAGLMILAVTVAGCGKKNDAGSVVQQVTPTPVEETVTVTPTPELVDMEATVEKNIMGEKTTTASKITIVNQTGSEIAAIYIRQTPSEDADEEESDDWGDDLVNGMFTLKSGENAVYYYEKPESSSATYDIRISYTDEEKNECFFRQLPLTTIKQITLRMDGKDDDAIPYATYMTANSTKEVSTLNDVKKRLGLSADDEDSDSATPTPTDAPDDSNTDDPDPTSAPSDNDNDNNNNNNNNSNNDDPGSNSSISKAESYIGMSIDDLVGGVGGAQSSEYDDDSATGTTGYYYYPNFTVSTSVDEDGNEIVTGVW